LILFFYSAEISVDEISVADDVAAEIAGAGTDAGIADAVALKTDDVHGEAYSVDVVIEVGGGVLVTVVVVADVVVVAVVVVAVVVE
jgi:hypothetical protein